LVTFQYVLPNQKTKGESQMATKKAAKKAAKKPVKKPAKRKPPSPTGTVGNDRN